MIVDSVGRDEAKYHLVVLNLVLGDSVRRIDHICISCGRSMNWKSCIWAQTNIVSFFDKVEVNGDGYCRTKSLDQ